MAFLRINRFLYIPFLSYTLNNFKFEEFIDNENDFSGNELTGVPKQILNLGFDFTSKNRFLRKYKLSICKSNAQLPNSNSLVIRKAYKNLPNFKR